MLEGMHHVAVIASDEGKALDFYVNKLGFTVEKETWRPAQQDYLPMRPSESRNRKHWGYGILPSG